MLHTSTILFFLILFLLFELLYFVVAEHYRIVDVPNIRSSHSKITIRGGGIIFPISCICWFFFADSPNFAFVFGLILIASISFLDDIISLSSKVRILFHLFAVCLLISQLEITLNWYWYTLIFVAIIGVLNGYNFMDGINGMTGGYSMITLSTLLFVNRLAGRPLSEEFMVFVLLSILIFNFFNFRVKARCFAGDVGSVSIAFIICFLLINLIENSGNFAYFGFLVVYGLDVVSTLIFRLIRRENILEAHRSHFYQFLANDKKWNHLLISLLYSCFQMIVNISIIKLLPVENVQAGNIYNLFVLSLVAFVAFVTLRLVLEGKGLWKRRPVVG